MADQFNLVGAVIFWLYIIAALVFTTIALSTIIGLRRSRTATHDDGNSRERVFSMLALISFAVLSYNMLHVLIQSFHLWGLRHNSHPSTDLLSLLQNIYHWSTTSTLFYDFATAIVASNARCLWVQCALFMTLDQCCKLALQGTAHHVPNLWAFFALSQILPISFAQNLFYLALLRTPSFRNQSQETPVATLKKSDADSMIGLYWTALLGAPLAAQSDRQLFGLPILMWIVLGTRAVLLVPRFLAKTQVDGEDRVNHVWVTGAIMWPALYAFIVRWAWILADSEPLSSVAPAVFEHPAVTALGMDFIISLSSLGIWNWLQPDYKVEERVQ